MATETQALPNAQALHMGAPHMQKTLEGENASMSSMKSPVAENLFREENTPQSNGIGIDAAQHQLQSLSLTPQAHPQAQSQYQYATGSSGFATATAAAATTTAAHVQQTPLTNNANVVAATATPVQSMPPMTPQHGAPAGSGLGLPFITPSMSPGPQLATHPIFLSSPSATPDPFLMSSYPLFSSRPMTPLYPPNLVPPTPGVSAFGGHTFMHPITHAPSPAPYPFPLSPAVRGPTTAGGPVNIPITPQGPVPTFFGSAPFLPMHAGATAPATLPTVVQTVAQQQHAVATVVAQPQVVVQQQQVPDSALPAQPTISRPNSSSSTLTGVETPPPTAPRPVRPQSTKPGDALNQLEMLKKATGEDDDDEEDSASAVATPKTAGTSSVATPATAKPTIVVSPPSASAASVAQATVAAAAAASTAAAVASAVLPVANTAGTLPLLGQITAAPAGGYAAPAGMSFEDHLLHLYAPTPPPYSIAPSPIMMTHPTLDMLPPSSVSYLPPPHSYHGVGGAQFSRDHFPPISPQHARGIPQSSRHVGIPSPQHAAAGGAPPSLARHVSFPNLPHHRHGGGHYVHARHHVHGPISPVNKQPPRMETAAPVEQVIPEMPHLAQSRSLPHSAYDTQRHSHGPSMDLNHPSSAVSPRSTRSGAPRHLGGSAHVTPSRGVYHRHQSPPRSVGRTKGRYDDRPALHSPRSYPNLSEWAPRNQYASTAGDEHSESEFLVRGVRSPGSTHSHRSHGHQARSPRGGGRPRGSTFSHYEPDNASTPRSPHVTQRKSPMSPRGRRGGDGGYNTRSRATSMNGAPMSPRHGGGAQGYTPNAINGVNAQGVTLVNGVPLTAQNFMEQARIETGSRSLQNLVERNPEVFRLVFTQMLECFWILSKDFFGNYLCQKLLECCDEANFTRLISSFAPRLEECCYDHKGSRVVVKVVELTRTKEQRAIVLGAMRPNLLNLMRDQYGCHVVKLLLHKFPLDELDFLFETVHENCRDLGEVQFGLCVLKESFQKVISLLELKPDAEDAAAAGENDAAVVEEKESAASSMAAGTASLSRKERELVMSKDPDAVIRREIAKLFKPSVYGLRHYQRFVAEITTSALSFVNNSFGNYILQELIEKSAVQVRSLLLLRLHQKFGGSYCALAVKKCASNVVETFLRTRMEYVNRAICTELLKAVNFGKIVRDKFGNYVVQVALDTASNDQKRLLCKKITEFLNENRLPNHQSRIKWEKKLRNVQAYLEDPSVRLIARQPKKKVYRSTAK